MSELKNEKVNAEVKEAVEEELDLDELDQVAGGSIGNVRKQKTLDISDSVAKRF